MKITEEQASDILWGEDEHMIAEHVGHWISDGKNENCCVVFKGLDDKFYRFCANRSGSYYTDYDYQFYNLDCVEVAFQEVVEHRWMPIDVDLW